MSCAMADSGEKVQLYIYDLSNGLARQMSMALIGKQVRETKLTMLLHVHKWPARTICLSLRSQDAM